MIAAHTDVVGSLLRPPELLKARGEVAAGKMTQTAFKAIEDQAVDEAVALQEAVGLEVVTDGEMRRLSFQSQMTEAVAGFGEYDLDAFLWGDWHGDEGVGDFSMERPRNLGVVGKLTRKRHLSTEEFIYLRARTTRIPKITLPSPSLWDKLLVVRTLHICLSHTRQFSCGCRRHYAGRDRRVGPAGCNLHST